MKSNYLVGQKKLISQRWDEELIKKVKSYSDLHKISATEFTSNALTVYMKLMEYLDWDVKEIDSQIEQIENLILIFNNIDTYNLSKLKQSGNEISGDKIGYIKKRIMNYLKSHPNKKFRTTDISDLLDIPQPTVRTYVREIAENHSEFNLYRGRPNVIEYRK